VIGDADAEQRDEHHAERMKADERGDHVGEERDQRGSGELAQHLARARACPDRDGNERQWRGWEIARPWRQRCFVASPSRAASGLAGESVLDLRPSAAVAACDPELTRVLPET
jgi:hypothetical protein